MAVSIRLAALAGAALVGGGLASAVSAEPAAVPAVSPAGAPAQPAFPADMPDHFQPKTDSFDFERRDVMIPMRDGVKLHTVILTPKGASRAPMMLDRTPYNATEMTTREASSHMADVVPQGYRELAEAGYIIVVQDVRGKYGSQGEYVNERPLRGPDNPTSVDHATDAYDTIDWLVKNVPQSNGRVGMIGTSYDGMMVLMALADPHPALKAAVPINPVGNTWMGDDDFHGGAFRLIGYDYYYSQDAQRGGGDDLWRNAYDDYDTFLRAGSASDFARTYGLDQLGFVRKLAAHPAYDAYWKAQALEDILANRPHKTPVLFVQGQWDQEDIYGAVAVWEATRKIDTMGEDRLVIGPWHHGQANGDGSELGDIKFDGDTAAYFRRYMLLPFLDAHLRDAAPPLELAPVTAYETGTDIWRGYKAWPPRADQPAPIYLRHGGGIGFSPLSTGSGAVSTSYVSDPAKPVSYRLRPIRPTYSTGSTWSEWLVDDQRNFSDRPDVLTYETAPLTAPVRIAGFPKVNLWASTSGTDSDWVVKLIDVYADEVPSDPKMGGYQLMISADIFRGRYRQGFDRPEPIPAGRPELYHWSLPTADHVFLPGHRIMVQVQSSWFPLYDRNPQTFVPNIFDAKAEDYRAATQHIFDGGEHDSSIELPILPMTAEQIDEPEAKPPLPQ